MITLEILGDEINNYKTPETQIERLEGLLGELKQEQQDLGEINTKNKSKHRQVHNQISRVVAAIELTKLRQSQERVLVRKKNSSQTGEISETRIYKNFVEVWVKWHGSDTPTPESPDLLESMPYSKLGLFFNGNARTVRQEELIFLKGRFIKKREENYCYKFKSLTEDEAIGIWDSEEFRIPLDHLMVCTLVLEVSFAGQKVIYQESTKFQPGDRVLYGDLPGTVCGYDPSNKGWWVRFDNGDIFSASERSLEILGGSNELLEVTTSVTNSGENSGTTEESKPESRADSPSIEQASGDFASASTSIGSERVDRLRPGDLQPQVIWWASRPKPQPKDNAPTFFSLFTGGGGFDAGVLQAGFKLLGGVELNPEKVELSHKIADCYEANYGHGLIRETVQDWVARRGYEAIARRPDWLHISLPCCNFSLAKRDRKESDEDIAAAKACCELIKEWRSPILTFEQVPEWEKSESWFSIECCLRKLGYQVNPQVLNLADFGVPQARKRFIVRACLNSVVPPLPANVEKVTGWYEAIADLVPHLPNGELTDSQIKKITNQGFLLDRESILLIERVGGGSVLKIRRHDEPAWTIKASLCTDDKSAERFEPINIWFKGVCKKVTPRVLARLSTIADWYKLDDNYSVLGAVIGNCVPPYFSEQIGLQFFDKLLADRKRTKRPLPFEPEFPGVPCPDCGRVDGLRLNRNSIECWLCGWDGDSTCSLNIEQPNTSGNEAWWVSKFSVGDRVKWRDAENSSAIYEIVKIKGGHATIQCIEYYNKPHPALRRRVPFLQLDKDKVGQVKSPLSIGDKVVVRLCEGGKEINCEIEEMSYTDDGQPTGHYKVTDFSSGWYAYVRHYQIFSLQNPPAHPETEKASEDLDNCPECDRLLPKNFPLCSCGWCAERLQSKGILETAEGAKINPATGEYLDTGECPECHEPLLFMSQGCSSCGWKPGHEQPKPDEEWIDPRQVTTTSGTQSRFSTNPETIERYAELMRDGLWDWERKPLPVVFQDTSGKYYSADCHHRTDASISAGVDKVLYEVRKGEKLDAILFSCAANTMHGEPLRPKDNRKRIEMFLDYREELPITDERRAWSSRQIAKYLNLSESGYRTVCNIIQERQLSRKVADCGIEMGDRVEASQNLEQIFGHLRQKSPGKGLCIEADQGGIFWIHPDFVKKSNFPVPAREAVNNSQPPVSINQELAQSAKSLGLPSAKTQTLPSVERNEGDPATLFDVESFTSSATEVETVPEEKFTGSLVSTFFPADEYISLVQYCDRVRQNIDQVVREAVAQLLQGAVETEEVVSPVEVERSRGEVDIKIGDYVQFNEDCAVEVVDIDNNKVKLFVTSECLIWKDLSSVNLATRSDDEYGTWWTIGRRYHNNPAYGSIPIWLNPDLPVFENEGGGKYVILKSENGKCLLVGEGHRPKQRESEGWEVGCQNPFWLEINPLLKEADIMESPLITTPGSSSKFRRILLDASAEEIEKVLSALPVKGNKLKRQCLQNRLQVLKLKD